MLRLLRERVGDDLTLIGVGGITTAADARARLDAGADLLQGYTAFIYEGPGWPRRILEGTRMTTFGARFAAALEDRGPLCAGIDPHAGLLAEWGLPDDVSGLERFALTAVEGLAPYVAVVKPQSAFYERFGSRGVAVLERVLAESRAAGALVLLDVKRGDIGSTTQAYADAYLDPSSPLAADAITASPYLGFGSLDPMVDTARKYDAGLFVLALTSNKEGPEVQHARTEDGQLVAGRMLDHLRPLNAGEEPLGSFGAVIGATIGDVSEPGGPGLRLQRADPRARVRRPGRDGRRHPAHLRRGRGRGHAELVARAAPHGAHLSRRCGTRPCGSTTSWRPCTADPPVLYGRVGVGCDADPPVLYGRVSGQSATRGQSCWAA